MIIITYPNKILLQIAEPVQSQEMEGAKILIELMYLTMRQHDGFGLAAPQVGISKRLIVWAGPDEMTLGGPKKKICYAINPVIVYSHGKIRTKEGCLSIPNIQREVKRKRIIAIEAINEHGQQYKQKFENMDAVIIQHEINHLNGIIILDNAKKRNEI